MTDKATQVIAEAFSDAEYECDCPPIRQVALDDTHRDQTPEIHATVILAALKQARIALVELPEPKPGYWDTYEEDGDAPDHETYGDDSKDFAVTTWHTHPDGVQVSHQGEPLEPITPAEARALAAALLAAADAAEENQ